MQYKVTLNVYNPKIIEVLESLKYKRPWFILMAMEHYLKTKEGKEMLRVLKKETKEEDQNPSNKINIDKFL